MRLASPRAVVGALLGASSFALYAAMAARDVMFGDGPELTVAAFFDGVAHPPGYPLWVTLGHLATLVPLGGVPFRVNLTACAYHAATVVLVYASALVLTRRIGPSIFAAALLAIASPVFVLWSLQAEVFSLDDLFAAAIVLLSLLWLGDPARWKLAFALAALFGLGLSNHQTLVLLSPLPLWTAWCARRSLPGAGRTIGAAALAVLVAVVAFALPYAHTLLASQHLTYWAFGEAKTLAQLVDVIDRHAFGTFDLVPGKAEQGGSALDRVADLIAGGGWTYAGIALGVAGLALKKRWRELMLAGLVLAFALAAFAAVANVDLKDDLTRAIFARFGLLALVALAPFSACAVDALESVVHGARARAIVAGASLAAAFAWFAWQLPQRSLAGVHDPRTVFADVARALPPRAILLTAGDAVDLPPLYFQEVEGWRPDVTIVPYGYLNDPSFRATLRRSIAVPEVVAYNLAPEVRRDLLVRANPGRPFYVTGDRAAHAPGPWSYPSVYGVVSAMVRNTTRVDLRSRFGAEVALQTEPGYAQITDDPRLSNGFADTVRSYYAGGFFSTGTDAERLGDAMAARLWYQRAAAYSNDPLITNALQRLGTP